MEKEITVVVVGITGVTLTGNMGGTAMLRATMDGLQARMPRAEFRLFSVLYRADSKLLGKQPAPLQLVDSSPWLLLFMALPLSVLLWPLRRLACIRLLASRLPVFRDLAGCHVIVDLAGIAFVDGRGVPLLLYNASICVPAQFLGVPVVKLSQALGPFRSPLNRIVARAVLSRCQAVVARGDRSFAHLTELGIDKRHLLPDTTFALEILPAHHQEALAILGRLSPRRPVIVVSPSEVVRRYLAKNQVDFIQVLTQAILPLCDEYNVVLLAHSCGAPGSKNDDETIVRQLAERLGKKAHFVAAVQDPQILRAIIGQAAVFVGSRFHAVVSALSMGVPSLVIGWSHKYLEMVEPLQGPDYVVRYELLSQNLLSDRLTNLLHERHNIAAMISGALPNIRQQVGRNFDLVVEAKRGK